MSDAPSEIQLTGLIRRFREGGRDHVVLDGVDLDVARGETVALRGRSGSGKSTLLSVLGLLDSPTSGNYWLDDISTATMADDELAGIRQKKIGFVFQSFHLVPRMNAFENVELPIYGLPVVVSVMLSQPTP